MKLNIFSKKNLLDEMQEQKLLKVESRGFWLMWWGLLISMLVQMAMGATAKDLTGEWIVFMIACLYSLEECLRNGIWDRHIRVNLGANLVGSFVAGAAVFVLGIVQRGYWPGALFSGIFTAILCLVVLQVITGIYKKRHEQLEHLEEDDYDGTNTNQ